MIPGGQTRGDWLQRQGGVIGGDAAGMRSPYRPKENSQQKVPDAARQQSEDAFRRQADAAARRSQKFSERGQATEPGAVYQEYELGEYQDPFEKQNEEFFQLAIDNYRRVLSGDMDLSPETEKYINETVGRVREPMMKALDEMDSLVKTGGSTYKKALGDWGQKIEQTGLSMMDALDEMGSTVKQTGGSISDALENSIAMNRQLGELGLKDVNKDLRKNMSERAAQLGRAPTDPAFVRELHDQMLEQRSKMETTLGAQEAQARTGLAERTGAGLEEVSRGRLGATERTGAGAEEVARAGAEYVPQQFAQRSAIAEQRGMAGVQAGELENIQRGYWGTEFPAQAARMASEPIQLREQVKFEMPARRIGIAAGQIQPQQQMGLQERMAQPTTTRTETPSAFDRMVQAGAVGAGVAGAGAQAGWWG